MSKWHDIETIPCPGLLEAQLHLKQVRQPLTDALDRWREQQEQIQAANPHLTPLTVPRGT